jgi:hypothetical protein
MFEIENGATITISNGNRLNVEMDANIYGHILLTNDDLVVIDGDLNWKPGSEATLTSNAIIRVFGDMIIENRSDLDMNSGMIMFQGTTPSQLVCHEDSAALFDLYVKQDAGTNFFFSSASTEDLKIKNNLYSHTGNIINALAPTTLEIGGAYFNYGANLYCSPTHILLTGYSGGDPLEMSPGDYFQDLTIATQSIVQLSDTYSSSLQINGDFTIDTTSATNPGLDANGIYITAKGNWENRSDSNAFVHGNNIVEFDNMTFKQIRGPNTFYELIENTLGAGQVQIQGKVKVDSIFTVKHRVFIFDTLVCNNTMDISIPTTDVRVMAGKAEVYVDTLIQGGELRMMTGNMVVNDLYEDYLGGNYIVQGGSLEIHQDASSSIDLVGDITIDGGTMSVHGGSGDSFWPRQVGGNYPTVTMSDGIIDFVDNGIRVEGEPLMNYNVTTNITGGTIRTAGDFLCQGAGTNFNPTGGAVEMYGSSTTYCRMLNGNSFWDLHISKTGGVDVYNSFGISVKNHLKINSGIFRESGYPVNVGP